MIVNTLLSVLKSFIKDRKVEDCASFHDQV